MLQGSVLRVHTYNIELRADISLNKPKIVERGGAAHALWSGIPFDFKMKFESCIVTSTEQLKIDYIKEKLA